MNQPNIFNRTIAHDNFCGYIPRSLVSKQFEKEEESLATLNPAELARYYTPNHYVQGYADPAFSGGEYTRGLSFHDYKAREELNKFKHDDLPLFMYTNGDCLAKDSQNNSCIATPINDPYEGTDNMRTVFTPIDDTHPIQSFEQSLNYNPPSNNPQTEIERRNQVISNRTYSLNGNNFNLSNVYGAVPMQDVPLYPEIPGIETKNPKTSLQPSTVESFNISIDKNLSPVIKGKKSELLQKFNTFINNQTAELTNYFNELFNDKPENNSVNNYVHNAIPSEVSYIPNNNAAKYNSVNELSLRLNPTDEIECFNIDNKYLDILPFLSEQYLNALKTRAIAVCYYLQTNPAYQYYAQNWSFLKSNLDKSKLLFNMLSTSDADIAYVINKGENINFRILDNSRYVPINIYQYVLYHEMAHMSTQELQHTDKFKELLAVISLAGYELGFIDLNKMPHSFYNTNGQPILSKQTMKEEIMDGCMWLIKHSNQKNYYQMLCEHVKCK